MLNFKSITAITLVLLLILVALHFYASLHYFWILFIISLWFIITMLGSFTMSWNFHLKAITSIEKISTKKIAITFDDGPHPELTPLVLELLEQFDAKGTFFCIGQQAELYPEIVKLISYKGHLIGNHSYSHGYFIDFKTTKGWVKEINHTGDIIKGITGTAPTLFRPPYGVTTPPLSKTIKQTNHVVVGWNNRAFDTILKNKNLILKRLKKQVKPGGIILLHDTQEQSLYILEHLLLYLKQHNYHMVTINDLLNEKH